MFSRLLFLLFLFATTAQLLHAQTQPTLIAGIVAEKKNIVITLVKSLNGKTERVADYVTDPSNSHFAFSFFAEPEANYKLGIQLMKQGHRHLESEKNYTFPLYLNIGQHNQIKIIPSQLDTATKKGFELKTSSETSKLAHISGKLLNANIGGTISVERVVEGSLKHVTGSN